MKLCRFRLRLGRCKAIRAFRQTLSVTVYATCAAMGHAAGRTVTLSVTVAK